MSDLPASALDYTTVVSEYFLSLRGSGLLLSPLDRDVIADWERRGVPVAVVCRGLRRGAEDHAARGARGAPRSLRGLRLAVEDEWRAYQSGRVGDAPAPPDPSSAASGRLERARALLLEAAGASASTRAAYRAALEVLDRAAPRGTPLDRLDAAFADADARLLRAWLSGLPRPERVAVGPRLRLAAGPRPRGGTRRAYRDALLAHLSDSARAAGLTCLRGSV